MRPTTPTPVEVILQPGGFFFSDLCIRVRPLLDSCAAITIWHPKFRAGGIYHLLLPTARYRGGNELGGHHADDALGLFLREIRCHGAPTAEYQVKIFSDRRAWPEGSADNAIASGSQNVEAAQRRLLASGFSVQHEHLAGGAYHHLVLDIVSGALWARQMQEVGADRELQVA